MRSGGGEYNSRSWKSWRIVKWHMHTHMQNWDTTHTFKTWRKGSVENGEMTHVLLYRIKTWIIRHLQAAVHCETRNSPTWLRADTTQQYNTTIQHNDTTQRYNTREKRALRESLVNRPKRSAKKSHQRPKRPTRFVAHYLRIETWLNLYSCLIET